MSKIILKQELTVLDTDSIKKASLVIRSINHTLRQQMLKVIDEAGEINITDLYTKLNLEQSVCSQMTAILRKQGIVKTRRDGKWIWYSIDYERLKKVISLAEQML